jgi:hypothetical protein
MFAGNRFAVSQAGVTFTISGHVTLDGQPLARVTVVLVDFAALQGYTALTDTAGYYSFSFQSGRRYQLRASLTGYSFTPDSVEIDPDK